MANYDDLGYVTEVDFLTGIIDDQLKSRTTRLRAVPEEERAKTIVHMLESGVLRAVLRRAPLHTESLKGHNDRIRGLFGLRMPEADMESLMQSVNSNTTMDGTPANVTEDALCQIILKTKPVYIPKAEDKDRYLKHNTSGNALVSFYRHPDKLAGIDRWFRNLAAWSTKTDKEKEENPLVRDPWVPIEMVRWTGMGNGLQPRYTVTDLASLYKPLRAFCEAVCKRAGRSSSTRAYSLTLNPIEIVHYSDDSFDVRQSPQGVVTPVNVPTVESLMLRIIVAGLYPQCEKDAGVKVRGMPMYYPVAHDIFLERDLPAGPELLNRPAAASSGQGGAAFGGWGAAAFGGRSGASAAAKRAASAKRSNGRGRRAGAGGRAERQRMPYTAPRTETPPDFGPSPFSDSSGSGSAAAGNAYWESSSQAQDESSRLRAQVEQLQKELQSERGAHASAVAEQDYLKADARNRENSLRDEVNAQKRAAAESRERLQQINAELRQTHAAAAQLVQEKREIENQLEEQTAAMREEFHTYHQQWARELYEQTARADKAEHELNEMTIKLHDMAVREERTNKLVDQLEKELKAHKRVQDNLKRELHQAQSSYTEAVQERDSAYAALDEKARMLDSANAAHSVAVQNKSTMQQAMQEEHESVMQQTRELMRAELKTRLDDALAVHREQQAQQKAQYEQLLSAARAEIYSLRNAVHAEQQARRSSKRSSDTNVIDLTGASDDDGDYPAPAAAAGGGGGGGRSKRARR